MRYAGWMVALVCLAVNWNTLGNEWCLEDGRQFGEQRIIYQDTFERTYRPLTSASYSLNRLPGAVSLKFHRATNLALAALNCALLFALLTQLLKDRLMAAASAMLFAVLPAHAEAINSIGWGRCELLGGFFALSAWYAHTVAVNRSRRKLALTLAPSLLFFLALLASETKYTFAPVPLICEFFFRARGNWTCFWARLRGRTLALHLLLGLALAIYALLRVHALGEWMPAPDNPILNPLQYEGIAVRIWTALRLFGMGLAIQLFPTRLVHDYSWHSFPLGTGSATAAFLLLLLMGAYCASILCSARLARGISFALLFQAIALLPFLNLIHLLPRIFGEAYLYWPSVGTAILAGAGAMSLLRWSKRTLPRRLAPALVSITVGAVVASFAIVSILRNGEWSNTATLVQSDAPKQPRSAWLLLRSGDLSLEQGDLDRADEQFSRGYRIHPGSHELANRLATVYLLRPDLENARRMAETAIRLAPKKPAYRANLGLILARQGQVQEALAIWEGLMREFPSYAHGYYYRGVLRESQNDYWGAEQDYDKCMQLDPTFENGKLHLQKMRFLLQAKKVPLARLR